jgi:hypothetical protein
MKEDKEGKDAQNIPAPPDHKQKLLITLLREHLDVINVYKLGKSIDRVSEVRHFIERSKPMKNGKDYLLIKTAVMEEARVMEDFLKALKAVKSKL